VISLAQPQAAGQHYLCSQDPHAGFNLSLNSALLTGI
jgi:hypothetical protein